jgi:4-hydroxy-3-methylbut-2-enyl diphosphate reductase
MTDLVVAAPLRLEALAVGRGTRAARSHTRVVRTGAGRRAALTLDSPPEREALAVAGLCGALSPDLKPGDVVVATEVRGPHGTVLCPSAPFLVAAIRAQGLTAVAAPLLSNDRIVDDRRTRLRLGATGAVAVDMETSTLLADHRDRPVAAVRVVVDTVDTPLRSPRTVSAGVFALRVLGRLAPALEEWRRSLGAREVVLAEPRSFCAGVERAIATVEQALERVAGPVYVRRQIVHNAHVVADLERRGAIFVQELDEAPDGAAVVLAAHGVSPMVREEAARRSLQVVDATCPLVAKVHAEARHARQRGDTIVLVGHRDHEEVEGTMGEAGAEAVVVETVDDVAVLRPRDPRRVTWLTQTTLASDETEEIVAAVKTRFPAARRPPSDDICYATTNRQEAVRQVAAQCDLVLVVGSENSSNSARLVEVAERAGARACLIDDATHVRPDLLAGASRIGITAGASAPPHLVDTLVDALRGLGPINTSTKGGGPETVAFGLPKEVFDL